MTPAGITARITATGVSRQAIPDLPKDQSVQLNVYDPTDPLGFLNNRLDIQYISFTGTTTSGWLEITWSGWERDGTYFDQTTKRLLSSCEFDPSNASCYSTMLIDLLKTAPVPPNPLVAFQVTVKAILGDVKNIQVHIYNSNDINGEIIPPPPSHISLKSIGTVGQAQTALSAVVPWRLPASGLFDFVLFSEETIKKE